VSANSETGSQHRTASAPLPGSGGLCAPHNCQQCENVGRTEGCPPMTVNQETTNVTFCNPVLYRGKPPSGMLGVHTAAVSGHAGWCTWEEGGYTTYQDEVPPYLHTRHIHGYHHGREAGLCATGLLHHGGEAGLCATGLSHPKKERRTMRNRTLSPKGREADYAQRLSVLRKGVFYAQRLSVLRREVFYAQRLSVLRERGSSMRRGSPSLGRGGALCAEAFRP